MDYETLQAVSAAAQAGFSMGVLTGVFLGVVGAWAWSRWVNR